jgi:hypothetical protein
LDTSQTFEFEVFLDYDPTQPTGPAPAESVVPDPARLDGGVFLETFQKAAPDPSSCHVLEFIAAHSFDPQSPHTPDSLGGSSVIWFYQPNGTCPTYDAGADGAVPDADADGPSDGGE